MTPENDNSLEMTPEQLAAAYAENLRLGYIKENGDGTFSVTEKGKKVLGAK